jgi:CheY-like chemotaxis protein
VALTAHALASDRDRSIEVGCVDFDTKPIDLPRLLGKIESHIRSSGRRPAQHSLRLTENSLGQRNRWAFILW